MRRSSRLPGSAARRRVALPTVLAVLATLLVAVPAASAGTGTREVGQAAWSGPATVLSAAKGLTVKRRPSATSATTSPTDVGSSPVGLGYEFDAGAQGWRGENVTATHDTTRAQSGAGSLRLTRTVTSSAFEVLRADDGAGALRDLRPGGDLLSAWLLVPAGTAGTWRARLDVQDERWAYRGGASQPVEVGRWSEVVVPVPADVAASARAVAVQLEVTGGSGTVAVNLDAVRQRPSGATTPTTSPTTGPTTGPTTSPTTSPTTGPTTGPTTSPTTGPTTGPTTSPTTSPTTGPTPGAPRGLQVRGRGIVDSSGRAVRLVGANHSGLEYACAQGWGFFDGPSSEVGSQTLLAGMRSWGATAVRVPLNEHCWLDVDSGIPANRRGTAYRKAVTDYVNLINANGMVAILDLHWHAPGTRPTDNNPMANRDNSPRFWTSVATHFTSNPSVVFELVNEPHPLGGSDSDEAWRCWRDGGTCSNTVDHATGKPYVAAGMQELMNAVRGTGARQLVLLGGVQWTNKLNGWLAHRPVDPVGNTAAAWHVYNFNACVTTTCFQAEVAPVADAVPVVATEIGPDQTCMTCQPSPTGFSERLLDFLDSRGAGWTAWTWNRWQGDSHVLVTDWSGTSPTGWGVVVRDRMRSITDSK